MTDTSIRLLKERLATGDWYVECVRDRSPDHFGGDAWDITSLVAGLLPSGDPSIRRLAEETTQEIYGKFSDIKNHIQRDCAYRARDIIESALTTLAQQHETQLTQVRGFLNADLKTASERVLTLELENQRIAQQIREEDARIVESRIDFEVEDEAELLRDIAAAIRARQDQT